MADKLDVQEAKAKILWNLLLINFFKGDVDEARKYGERSLALARQYGLREQLAFSLSMASWAYSDHGEVDRTVQTLNEVNIISEQSGFHAAIAFNHLSFALLYGPLGQIDQGLQHAQEAVSSTVGKIPFWSQAVGVLAYLQVLKGNLEQAEATIKQFYDVIDPARGISFYSLLVFVADMELNYISSLSQSIKYPH